MPIYEFECAACGHRFEELTGLDQADGRGLHCPKCDAAKATRVVSSFATGSGGTSGGPSGGGCGHSHGGGFT